MIDQKKLSMISLLAAPLFANLGLAGTAFANMDNSTEKNNNNTMTSSSIGNTTGTMTSSSNASKMMGVIASIQQDGKGRPVWITAGHWWLESDKSLTGNTTNNTTTAEEPHVNNFTANLYMVSNTNGTAFHTHKISNFTQTSLIHQDANSTTVNGTFTITLREGPVNNVHGYIHIMNDKMEFWVDPVASDNHFGPTTITGMILNPEKIGQMGGNYHGEMMNRTMTQGANATEGMMKNNLTSGS